MSKDFENAMTAISIVAIILVIAAAMVKPGCLKLMSDSWHCPECESIESQDKDGGSFFL